jgi:uncharacterized protein YndB with AHSA1/START domain
MDIKHQIQINAGAKTIYDALTTKKGIEGWWSLNCEINCKPGQESVMTFVKDDRTVVMHFITKEVIENKKLVWLCNDNGNPVWINSTLSFEITDGQNGKTLTFIHSGFDKQFKGHPAYQMTVDGWNFFMKSLISYCETGKGQAWG